MKIAVSSTGGSLEALLSEQFGRCSYFIIFDSNSSKFEAISNLGENYQSGAGPKAASLIKERGAEVILTGHVGDKAEDALNRAGIRIVDGFASDLSVRDAITNFLSR